MPAVTNIKASQALRGQGVTVTVATSEIPAMREFTVGEIVNTGSVLGTIYSVDYYGNSFKVIPIQPNLTYSDTRGYLDVDAIVESYEP